MSNPRDELKLLFATLIFVVIGLAAQNIALSALWGAKGQTFTLFDLISPIPVAFLGLFNGLAAIVIAKLLGAVLLGQSLELLTLLRLLPAVAGGLFFWAYTQKRGMPAVLQFGIPIAAIVLFCIHPSIWGTAGMLFSLYWVVPLVLAALNGPIGAWMKQKGLMQNGLISILRRWGAWFGRSLGATLTQHAVGGVLWLYTIPAAQNPAFWLALIPIVAAERLVFATGIATGSLGLEAVLARMTLLHRSLNRTTGAQPQHLPRKKR
ncbi:Uncharacterised protein [uncultured archaeon]|nr:Uncharacterised protein [uncultured archaeon]